MFKNVTVLILLLFLSCGGTDRVKDKLDHIESYIENKPESALKELESIDQNALSGKRMKAQYALLYSMALDKNYIDLKNDSIYGGGGISASRVYRETITSEELLEIAVSKALELGADGISNFQAKVIYNTTYTKYGTT